MVVILFLIAVEAPLEVRYKWAKARGRTGDDISFGQFKLEEEKERGGSSAHEVDKVIEMADHHIINGSSKEEMFVKTDKILSNLM